MNLSGRVSLLLFCLPAGLTSVAAAKDPGQLGHLAEKQGVVGKSSLPCRTKNLDPMNPPDPVKEEMCVQAKERSRACFDIDIGRGGTVRMGPESTFEFGKGLFDPTTGELNMNLEVLWGIFRFALKPPPPGQEAGTVRIKAGGRWIHLYGTDVFLRVEKNHTTVLYVAQGEVKVEGLEPRVKAGEWTTFGPGLPPQPPMPGGGDPAGRAHRRGEPEIPGPALLDLTSGRLDLPKGRLP